MSKSPTFKKTNPLLDHSGLPDFSLISIEHIDDAMDDVFTEVRSFIEKHLKRFNKSDKIQTDYDHFLKPLLEKIETIEMTWSPVNHLYHVKSSPELGKVYRKWLPEISAFFTSFHHDQRIYDKIVEIKDQDCFKNLTEPKRQTVLNMIRDFELGGCALETNRKKEFKDHLSRLALLSNRFSENMLKDEDNTFLHLEQKRETEGLPENILQNAAEEARERKKNGYMFSIKLPIYLPFMQNARLSELRKTFYFLKMNAASSGKNHNSPVISEILALKQANAAILGYRNHAEVSLVPKMAGHPENVENFLKKLHEATFIKAQEDIEMLHREKHNEEPGESIHPWDILYYSEKVRQKHFSITDESTRPYFPAGKVIEGILTIIEKIYGLTSEKLPKSGWNDKTFYIEFCDKRPRGGIWFDFFAREGKKSGAWMDECRPLTETLLPCAYVCCNFRPPENGTPALLTHRDVLTLFHETGHALQHILTEIKESEVSGIRGVPWDGVELASQFFENWAWEPEVISMISNHYKTGRPMEGKILDGLIKSKNFMQAYAFNRQIFFSFLDLKFHKDFNNQSESPHKFTQRMSETYSAVKLPERCFFENNFAHIFAGGYDSGYYSYKWAEVLAADCYAVFKKHGIFDRKTGKRFQDLILARGGSGSFMERFKEFTGHSPDIKPLLRSCGLI